MLSLHIHSYLKDFICASSTNCLESSSTSLYPISISLFFFFANLSNSQCHFAFFVSTHIEPKRYAEASKFNRWKQTMPAEITALERTGTWRIVDLPPGITPIRCRWDCKIKHHVDGSIERFKARLVVKGYNQVEGLDYFDTYSHVAKLTIARLVLALATINNCHLHQLDVNNAFLHGDLHEDIYMLLPPGTNSSRPNQVCKLVKSIYDL